MVSVESWLESFGFIRSPFETTEAGSEAYYGSDFLHETFVKPQGFDEILGHPAHPKSSLIFADRGKGKTSARLMTAHFCQEGIFPKDIGHKEDETKIVLPVHHTRFEHLVGASGQSALVNAHVNEILFRAVPPMVRLLLNRPEITRFVDKLETLRRLEIQYFLEAFKKYVAPQENKSARDLLGKGITILDEAKAPIGFVLSTLEQSKTGITIHEIEALLETYSQMQPIDLLGRFAALSMDLGFSAVYVLVDCVDEIPETSDNIATAAELLIPLLANLNLMTNTPNLAFKVFVPSEMETLLFSATQKVRRDRLAIQKIELIDDNLGEIFRRRLAYCSNGVVSSIDAVSSLEMRGVMEKEILTYANGNPRHLVLLGRYMLEHRCRAVVEYDDQEAYLLRREDLEWAAKKLAIETAPAIEKHGQTVILQETPEQQMVEQMSSSDSWFRHELPAPIAFSYLAYQRESKAYIRIWKMYELLEASLAFLSLVLLALLYQSFKDDTHLILKKNGLRLERTSMGAWRAALEKLPGMISGLGIRNSFARSCQRVLSKNEKFIKGVIEDRNRSAHGGPQSEKVCEALLEQYAKPLQHYLEGLSFLRTEYLLKVLDVQKRDEKYYHRCTIYSGDVFIFPVKEIPLNEPLESDSLWLLGRDGSINLEPLMWATPNEVVGEEIGLYHGVSETVIYKNYGTGKMTNSNNFREKVNCIIGN